MVRELLARVREWRRRRDVEDEIDAELAFHVDMQTEANLRKGMSADEARRAARLSLGGRDQVKEAVRDARGTWLDSVWQDVRYGARVLRRSPAYTVAVLATLGLGIGATTAVFTLADAVALRPLPYSQPDRLFTAYSRSIAHSRSIPDGQVSTGVATREFLLWREHQQEFGQVSLVGGGTFALVEGEPEQLHGCQLTGDLFATLGAAPLLGRVFGREHEVKGNHRVAVLAYGFWQRRFGGDPHIVGRRLHLDDGVYEVVGVMPARFQYPPDMRQEDLWTPLTFDASSRKDVSPGRGVVLRLKDGVTREQAEARLQALSAGLDKVPGFSWQPFLLPYGEKVVGETRRFMAMLLAAAGLVLLIACANVAHLGLSRASARSRELAVRRALGGGRLRVMRQLVTESLMLSTAATIVGMVLAWWGVRVLSAAAPPGLGRLAEIAIDRRVLVFAIGAGLATGLLSAILPAIRGSRADAVHGLADGGAPATARRGGRRFREALAFSEVALSFVLLAGAGLFIASFLRLMSVDTGFDLRNLLVLEISVPKDVRKAGRSLADMQAILERLRQTRGVVGAGAVESGSMFGLGRSSFGAYEPGAPRPTNLEGMSDFTSVTPGFFRTLGVPLLEGRDLTDRDVAGAPPVMLVNRTAARRHWGDRSPLGRRLFLVDAAYEVVGVVGDIAQRGSDAGARPVLYRSLAQTENVYGSFVIRVDGSTPDVQVRIRDAARSVWPHQPIERLSTLEDGIWRGTASRRFTTTLMAVFGLLAVVIAVSGLGGVMACTVGERRREMAIRIAFGAGRGRIIGRVLGRGAAIVLAGLAAGACAALGLGRYAASYLFEIKPHDARVLSAAALVLAAAAVLACWPSARRAADSDPVTALKTD